MDPIKEAFLKIKQDISSLKQEINLLKQAVTQIFELQHKIVQNQTKLVQQSNNPTNPTDKQTGKLALEDLRSQDIGFSTGNRGVPTDKQTNRQTNNLAPISPEKTDFDKASEAINSLNTLKENIKSTLKNLTKQEWIILELLYSLESQGYDQITYKIMSKALNLSESSIRDYINRLIRKGLPIDKIRLKNKVILLKVSQNLKNIASFEALLAFKESTFPSTI